MKSRKNTALPVCGLVLHFLVTDDVGFIVKGHAVIAEERSCVPELFIFADDTDLDRYKVIIVRISTNREVESCRKLVDVAAEVLTWVQVGL